MLEGAQKEISQYFKILYSEVDENPEFFLDSSFQKEIIKKIKSILAKVPEEDRDRLFDHKITINNQTILSTREILEKYHFNVVIEAFNLQSDSASNETSGTEEEYDEETIVQALQEVAKEKCAKKSKRGILGQFKRIEPIPGLDEYSIAVAILNNPGEKHKQELEHECELLRVLNEANLPSIKIYGEVFEVKKDYYGVLMQWVADATLLDGKDPDAIGVILPYLLLGEEIPSGEARVLFLDRKKLNSKIDDKIKMGEISQLRERAEKLHEEFAKLMQGMKSSNIKVGDLQLLINKENDVFIIDPIDVLHSIKDEKDPANYILVDAITGSKVESIDFKRSIDKSEEMLRNSKKWFKRLSNAENTKEFKEAFLDNPVSSFRKNPLKFDPPVKKNTAPTPQEVLPISNKKTLK